MNSIPRTESCGANPPENIREQGLESRQGHLLGARVLGEPRVLPEVGVSAVTWALEPGSLLSPLLGAWLRHILHLCPHFSTNPSPLPFVPRPCPQSHNEAGVMGVGPRGNGMIFLVCTDPPAPPAASWGASGALQLAPPACPLTH